MRAQITAISVLFFGTVLHAQETVCDLFKDLKSADGRQVSIRGELFLEGDLAALGATECDYRYVSEHQIWPTAIQLVPSNVVPDRQLKELKEYAAEIKNLYTSGQTVVAYGTFSGRLTLQKDESTPARLTFDDARNITVDALPPAETLPVIPICDLFQDLGAWKGKRIAVRAREVHTMEGAWLSGHCNGNFVTDGHRWPVSLTRGGPDYYGAYPFSLFRINEERNYPAIDTQGRQNVQVIATFVGRLRMRDQYVGVCRDGGDYIGNGFGHLAAAAAELIEESMRDVEIRPNLRLYEDEEADPPCVPPNHADLCAAARTLNDAAFSDCPVLAKELVFKDGLDIKNGLASGALATAIRTGHEDIALILIQAGAPLNPVTTAEWLKPLFVAANWKRLEILKALVMAGADVDQKDRNGTTWLASYGYFHLSISRILLDAGADPNARDSDGATALMHAAYNGYEDEVKLLLDHHAIVDLKDNKGRTALMYAAESEYVDAIPHLLAHNADPLWRDIEGHTSLDLAKKANNRVAVELLEKAIGARK